MLIITFQPLLLYLSQLVVLTFKIVICNFFFFFFFQGTLALTLREVRPTVFLGVPRVWEKIVESIKSAGRQCGSLRKKIAVWAKGVGLKGNYSRMNG